MMRSRIIFPLEAILHPSRGRPGRFGGDALDGMGDTAIECLRAWYSPHDEFAPSQIRTFRTLVGTITLLLPHGALGSGLNGADASGDHGNRSAYGQRLWCVLVPWRGSVSHIQVCLAVGDWDASLHTVGQ